MQSCLIVDDSNTVRRIIKGIMSNLSFEVSEAENGQVALDQCKATMPKLILLDWNMPIMSGIEFLKELRQTSGGQDPCVIMCTTENDMDHIQQAISEGANEYIMKPFNEEIIKEKLEIIGII